MEVEETREDVRFCSAGTSTGGFIISTPRSTQTEDTTSPSQAYPQTPGTPPFPHLTPHIHLPTHLHTQLPSGPTSHHPTHQFRHNFTQHNQYIKHLPTFHLCAARCLGSSGCSVGGVSRGGPSPPLPNHISALRL